MGQTYTSTIEVNCWKEHTCICCGGTYMYQFSRKVTGSAATEDAATAAAQAAAEKVIANQVDPQPCPTCGMLQPDMVGQQRKKVHARILIGAAVAFALVAILYASYAMQANSAVWLGVLFCAIAAAAHLAVDLLNPNSNLAANRQRAAERVSAGVVQYQPGQYKTGAEQTAWPARAPVQTVALGMLIFGVVLAMVPELVRSSRKWPLNADAYPPVLGPGDSTRIYMNEKITSIKSYWRGDPSVTLRDPEAPAKSARPVRVEASTNSNSWGDRISVKSSEKHNSSTPWVKITLPQDAKLAGKTLACDIELDVSYPAMVGDKTYDTQNRKLSRSVTLQIAPANAGQQYSGWWWKGTGVGMLLVLASGLTLLASAKALQGRANPTQVYAPA